MIESYNRRAADLAYSAIHNYLVEISGSLAGLHAKHDAFVKEMGGNSQPGRVGKLEQDVESLKRKSQYAAGFIGAVTLAWTILQIYWHKLLKH